MYVSDRFDRRVQMEVTNMDVLASAGGIPCSRAALRRRPVALAAPSICHELLPCERTRVAHLGIISN
jgi:hypothetical protein